MPAAARLSDKAQVDQDAHGCPACPHPGVGPIVTGSGDVFINGLPAARAQSTDLGVHAICCGPNTFVCKDGSATVYVNNKPLARMNDATKHCGGEGKIIEGSPDVLIDDGADAVGLGSYLMHALQIALAEALAFAKGQAKSHSDSHDGGDGGGGAGGSPSGRGGAGGGDLGSDGKPAGAKGGDKGAAGDKSDQEKKDEKKADDEQAKTIPESSVEAMVVNPASKGQAGIEFELTLSDGSKRAGKTDADGKLRADGVPKNSECTLELPDIKEEPGATASKAGRIRYATGGVKVNAGKAAVVEVAPHVRRGRLTGLLFETDKTFLLPQAMNGMRNLRRLYDQYPDIAVLISGHTDAQGPVDYNRGLSMERAESIKNFLLDNVEGWMRWYAGRPTSKRWAVREDQYMLSTVSDSAGAPFYAGPINGAQDAATTAAYKKFQSAKLLTPSGKPDGDTRRELVRAYMKLEGTSLPSDAKVQTHGCGLRHPAVVSPKADVPENRRVEVFLFDGAVDPPPQKLCPWAGCPEYPIWLKQSELTVDLDLPPGKLAAEISDLDGKPLDGAHVHLTGPLARDGFSAGGGHAVIDDVLPGDYKVIAELDGFEAADTTVTIASGATAPVQLKLKSIKMLAVTSLSDHFAPGAESADLVYDIAGFDKVAVTLRVTSATYPGNLIFERPLTAAEKAPGTGKKLFWNGITSTTSGPLATGAKSVFANPLFSPYRVSLIAAGGPTDSKDTKIQIDGLELVTGDNGTRYFMNTLGTGFEIAAGVRILKSGGGGVFTPCPIKVAFSFTPGAGNATLANCFQKPGTGAAAATPLAKGGDPTAVFWRARAGMAPTSADGFKATAAVDTITDNLPDKGHARVDFLPSGCGGDTYKLKVTVFALDGTSKLDELEGPELTVFRRIDFQPLEMSSVPAAGATPAIAVSLITVEGTDAKIAPLYPATTFVVYHRLAVVPINVKFTMKYIALWDTSVAAGGTPSQLDWSTHQLKLPAETPTASEAADANLVITGASPPGDAAKQAAARAAIVAKANAWVARIRAQRDPGWRAWVAAALPAIPAGGAQQLVGIFDWHPKYSADSAAADAVTHEWTAFSSWLRVAVSDPGDVPVNTDFPDNARWEGVQGFDDQMGHSIAFQVSGGSGRKQVIIAHEAGHNSKGQFARADFGTVPPTPAPPASSTGQTSDHSPTTPGGLMDMGGSIAAFQNYEILILRGRTA